MVAEIIIETPKCYKCGSDLSALPLPISRRESCPKCVADVHVCKNCKHYDPKVYNECREPQAERVVDKEQSNFCDYFVLVGGKIGAEESKEDVMKKLDGLFKK